MKTEKIKIKGETMLNIKIKTFRAVVFGLCFFFGLSVIGIINTALTEKQLGHEKEYSATLEADKESLQEDILTLTDENAYLRSLISD